MSSIEAITRVQEGWTHLQRARPLAAWASWQRALRIDPDDRAALVALERLATAPDLPAAARAVYRFQPPGDDAQRARWNHHLREEGLEDLDAAATAFRAILVDDPADHAAWINLGFCLAWQGRNAEAITALERVVALQADTDPENAADAWTLAEVLRLGAGAEPLADDLRYSWTLAWINGPPPGLIEEWPNLHPLPVPTDPVSGRQVLDEGQVHEWFDRPLPGQDAPPTSHPAQLPRRIAAVIVTPRLLRLSSPDPTGFSALDDDPRCRPLARLLASARREKTPLGLADADAALGTFRLPEHLDPDARRELSRSILEYYYEDLWIHLPRQGLGNQSPRDAAQGDAAARARLAGVVRFREQLGARATVAAIYQGYPFDRLRRRLGLVDPADCPATLDPTDVTCMSEAELAQLDLPALDSARLAEAFRSACAFRDDPLALRFATAVLDRDPPALAGVDPTALFAPLVRAAMSAGDPEAALATLARAIAVVDDSNALRTFSTWSAEILSRTGAADEAAETYRRLVETADDSHAAAVALDAAETLLDNAHPTHATPFLIDARNRARTSGDRNTLAHAERLLGHREP